MERRICRNSGLELSVLGTGCWTFGGGDYWGKQDQEDVDRVVKASVDNGINYFDTAEAYNEGRSESSLGEALQGIPRDKYLIGTKVSPSNCYRDQLISHCEASLQRLRTSHIDIYMIHWPIHSHSIRHFTGDQEKIANPPGAEEALEALLLLKEQGKIRHIAVSNFSPARLQELPVSEIAVNQLPYNLLCRAIEYDTISYCSSNGIGIIGYMALMQGILTGKYSSFDSIPVMQRRTRHFSSLRTKEVRHGEAGAEEETREALEKIKNISVATGLSMNELAIRWVLKNSSVTCSLAGSRNRSQLEANIKTVAAPLSSEIKEELDKITQPLKQKLGNHFDYYENASNDRTL